MTAYVLLAELCDFLFTSHGAVSFLWLASGIALTVLLEGGNRYLPALFTGALLGNWLTGFSFDFSIHNAIRHTFAAYLSIFLLKREGNFDARLYSVGDFLRIIVLALFTGLMIASLAQVQSLISEHTVRSFYQRLAGNSLGIMLMMPLLLVWRQLPREWMLPQRAAETLLIIGLTFLVGQVIFLDWLHDSLGQIARGYWMFLLITWAAVRLELHGAVLILMITAIQGLIGAQLGLGFFSNDIAKTQLANYYFYMICLSGTGISLATYIAARKRDQTELTRYKDHLEEEVHARTQQLEISNRSLTETTSAMDRAGIGIHWINADTGRFLHVNDYAASMLGYSRQELGNLGVQDLDPDFTFDNFRTRTLPLREMGAGVIQTRQRHKDGHIVPIEVSFYYLPPNDELPPRFISFITDITLRKKAEAEILSSRDAAEAANKAKSSFLANMSHELRTPLNAILGFSSLMRQDTALTETQISNLSIINRSGNHLLTLINDILEMAKIEAGRIQIENAPFDLGALVREIVDMMEIRAREKGLQLLLDQTSEFPRYINGDEVRLRQILINLVGNAVKFTDQGGVTVRLGTRQNSHSHLIVEVEDSGRGISSDDQKKLFQPFVQLGKQAGKNKGTGLGLAITHQLVQLMGGNITVESTPGKGSLFRVDLALSEARHTEVPETVREEKGEVTGLAQGQRIYRILIVEDQLENQLLLSQLMERIGFEVKIAENGEAGVALFQSWHPDLIWMVRRMPVMDGMESTKIIRKLTGGLDVKIFAVTASDLMQQRDEILAVGMDEFVRKPYRFSEIYNALNKQLGVQYVYSDTPVAPEKTLTREMLAVLPAELHTELKNALESLKEESINVALAKVENYDCKLHKVLRNLADNFDYPAILNLLISD